MMMNMKTVLFTDWSRASPSDPGGLSKDGFSTVIIVLWEYIRRRPSGSMIIIWAGMIGNEVTGLFRLAGELKRSADMFC